MIIDLSSIGQTLKQEIADMAEKDLRNYTVAATADGYAIINKMQAELENWTAELAAGLISKSDFADLVAGQKDELEMTSLEQAGLAKITVDQFKQDICDLITNMVLALLP